MSDLKGKQTKTQPEPEPETEPTIMRCLNPKCKRTCDKEKNAKVRILGGRVVRYCCHRCMIVHGSTGVVTKPVPQI